MKLAIDSGSVDVRVDTYPTLEGIAGILEACKGMGVPQDARVNEFQLQQWGPADQFHLRIQWRVVEKEHHPETHSGLPSS